MSGVTQATRQGDGLPRLPPRCALGRPSEVDLREVVNAILFIAGTRCHGELRLPKEFPPYATVQGYWYAWRDKGRWEMINHARSGRQELEET